jgi:hypothetical protein
MKLALRKFATILAVVVCFAASALAAERPFYQGKNLTFLINYAAGGPTDIEGRIVARHLARHIPGNPAVVAEYARRWRCHRNQFSWRSSQTRWSDPRLLYRSLQSPDDEKSFLENRFDAGAVHRFCGKRDGLLHPFRCPPRNKKTDRPRQSGTFQSRGVVF